MQPDPALAAVPPQNALDVAPPPDGAPGQEVVDPAMQVVTRAQVEQAGLNAMLRMADKAAATDDAREAKEYAGAYLNFAQGNVIMDPDLVSPQGVPADALHPPTPPIQMDKTQGVRAGAKARQQGGGGAAPAQ